MINFGVNMALDIKNYRTKLKEKDARINLVPLIDVIFTILIFLMVTNSIQAVAQSSTHSGKPEVNQASGPAEYYLIPVSGLKTVLVNGKDMSSYIRNDAIAVHTDVIDKGEIIIKARVGTILITTPTGISPEKAVSIPKPY
jgi:biopolymer transport protein ExbD